MRKGAFLSILLGVTLLLFPGSGVAADVDPWTAARFIKSIEKPAAPDFAARDVEGGTVRLREFRGKVVMLFFWAEW